METTTPEAAKRFNPMENFVPPPVALVATRNENETAPDAAGSTPIMQPEPPKPNEPKPAVAPQNAVAGNTAPKIPDKPAKNPPSPLSITKMQRQTAREKRLAAFDKAFRAARFVVMDAICHAAAPDAIRAEMRRADVFYQLAREDAARGSLPDVQTAAENYKNARLRSLQNALQNQI